MNIEKEGTTMGKLEVIKHPLIQHKLSILRRTDTSTKAFRELVDEIAMLMGCRNRNTHHKDSSKTDCW